MSGPGYNKNRRVRDWMDGHPWTTIYIAVVVTLLLILRVVELAV